MDRITFNRAVGIVLRRLLQCAEREHDARVAKARLPDMGPRSNPTFDAAQRAVDAAASNTDAAVMEFSDTLFDALVAGDPECPHCCLPLSRHPVVFRVEPHALRCTWTGEPAGAVPAELQVLERPEVVRG